MHKGLTCLIFGFALLFCLSAQSAQVNIPGPPGSNFFGEVVRVLPNGNIVVVDCFYSIPNGPSDVGAVYLYSPEGALISTLTGTKADDRVGYNGVRVLNNGNYLVLSDHWSSDTATDVGAVTWCSATGGGLKVVVSAENSLVGNQAGDRVGYNSNYDEITMLPNGNYLVVSSFWQGGAGAVTWGSAETGVKGVIAAANSLVGSTGSDGIGAQGITILSNGNYVVTSTQWTNAGALYAGAVTWGSGAEGTSGVVSGANSLVGSRSNDRVGGGSWDNGVVALSQGNYVVASPNWTHGIALNAGAVTWADGSAPATGLLSVANSLVGTTGGDRVGEEGITLLANGNYVVSSPRWSNESVFDAGAVTWGHRSSGVKGAVSSSNSLVGSESLDFEYISVVPLTNGNYVVAAPYWNHSAIADAGAAIWADGATGISGEVLPATSLVGSQEDDRVGSSVTALSNGHYVVCSPDWDNGDLEDVGGATWGDGTTGIAGMVSAANSLVGTVTGDYVGSYATALSNGHYVVSSPWWKNGTDSPIGAFTWANGVTGRKGTVSAGNSLIGSHSRDSESSYVVALPNGNYLVSTHKWDNGSLVDAGAVTWGNGTMDIVGVIGSGKSLVGDAANETVGIYNCILTLPNGNYVIRTDPWRDSMASHGAITWGNGSSGIAGAVSAANSLVRVGVAQVTLLANSNYVVRSFTAFGSPLEVTAGSVTWCDGSKGRVGYVSSANSLINTGTENFSFPLRVFSDGSYAFNTHYSPIGTDYINSVTICAPTGVAGLVDASNSVFAISPWNYFYWGSYDYDVVKKQLAVGRLGENILSLFTPSPTVPPSDSGLSADASTIIITGYNFSLIPGNNEVIFAGGWRGVVLASTATQLTVGNLPALVAGPLQATIWVNGVVIGSNVQVGLVAPRVSLSTGHFSTSSTTLILRGYGFSTTLGNNSVTFSHGVTGTILNATATSLTIINLTGLATLSPGTILTATVTANGQSSGLPIQVGVLDSLALTVRTSHLGINAPSFIIYGTGFSTTVANNVVTLSNGATCLVTAATATQLTLGSLNGLTEGVLLASVTVNGTSSGAAVQVGTVIPAASGTISFNTAYHEVDQGTTSITLTIVRSGSTSATGVTVRVYDGVITSAPPASPAWPGRDYIQPTGLATTVDFAEGETSRTVTITLVANQGDVPNRNFVVELTAPVAGATLGIIYTTRVMILANDNKKPTVKLTAPAAGEVSAAWPFLLKGIAGDVLGIDRVEVILNDGDPINAVLESAPKATAIPFSLAINPPNGNNHVKVIAYDMRGNTTSVEQNFRFTRRYTLTVTRTVPSASPALLADKVGMVTLSALPAKGATALSPTTANVLSKTSSVAAAVTTLTLTATAKAGYVFSHWTGFPNTAVPLGNTLSFSMPAENTAITGIFIANPFADTASGGNVFSGLIHAEPETPANNDTEGFLTGTLTATSGAFTGKVMIAGLAQTVTALFFGDGSAVFTSGSKKQDSLTFGGRTLALRYELETGCIFAILSQGDNVSSGHAWRHYYSKTRKVAESLMDAGGKSSGYFTFAMPAKAQSPELASAQYPQGSGYGTFTVSNLGIAKLVGMLADGTALTGSFGLTEGAECPIFVQLTTPGAAAKVKGGSLGGTVLFDATPANSDVTAADLVWFRPTVSELSKPAAAAAATALYTNGWPGGITVDLFGALYAKTIPLQAGLGLGAANETLGNGELQISGEKLADTITGLFSLQANVLKYIPNPNPVYKLVLTPGTGVFSGSFAPTWTNPAPTQPAFKGMVIQKGTHRGGYGYFLSNRIADSAPESGAIFVGAP